MSDLKLVSPDQPTAFEQRLLDSVANEAPSAEQRLRVRLALGLPSVAPAPPPGVAVGRRALLLKAAGGASIALAALALLFAGLARKTEPAKRPAVPLVTPPLATPQVPAALPPPLLPPEPASASTSAVAPGAPDDHREGVASKRASKDPAHVPGSASADAPSDLSEQLRLIDAARSAVAAGNASAASVALSRYRTRFPRGLFGQEAAVLQIETLDLQGNHALAAAQARSFLARHPNSPHVGVVQRIAGR